MIPDLVINRGDTLTILDAKYYTLKGDSFPGVQDVAKQFVYEDVFKREEAYIGKRYANGFIVPGTKTKLRDSITMECFRDQEIEVVQINYKDLFKAYVQDRKINCTDLKLIDKNN